MSSPHPPGKRFVSTTVEVEGRVETKIVELPDNEPPPWGEGEPLQIVGQPVPRLDAADKVTGRARYTADVALPGMLFAAFVRAPHARATVTSLDVAAARALPGVVDVLVAADLPRPIRAGGVPLFSPDVSYPGQPVAAVCAESREGAEQAAAAVVVEYAPLPPVRTFEEAAASDAPKLRPAGNVMRGFPQVVERGNVDEALRSAEVVVTREYHTPCVLHTPMEPHATVAQWLGGDLTVWESTQGVFRVRDQVATAMGVPRSRVRVIKEHMGGGFGAKNHAGAHTFTAALFARRTGRPVRCVLDRTAEQSDGGNRPASRQVVTLGADGDGKLVAIDVVGEVPLGIGGWDMSVVAIHRELYACPNVRTRETLAYINGQEMQAFRAPGHVEGAFALERAMDVLAGALGVDPLALRLRNLATTDQDKGRPYSANNLQRCMEEGAARFGWAERTARRGDGATERRADATGEARRAGPTGPLRRGFGMAAQVWGTGGGPPAYATVRIESDGTVEVLSGTQDLGTGSRTILAQVAAEAVGAKLADVRVVLGDTERTPYAGNSWGSMTTPSVAPAVRSAGVEARRRLLEAAAALLECHPDDLEARDSVVTTKDQARRLTFAEITRKLGNVMIMGNGSRGPNPQGVGIASFGAQFAEVEVDTGTGVVRVLRIVAAHDVGRVLNPLLAGSQLEGGILQGLGYALFEERRLDPRSARPVNPSLHDYRIPTIADTPAIDAFCIESVDIAANHVGARGLAEPPIIPTAPAIANAVADALGVEVSEIPLTPWRVLAAMG